MNNARDKCVELLALADIQVNGDRPWDIQVNNDDLYMRLLAEGSLALGEGYTDGWWGRRQCRSGHMQSAEI